MQTFERCRISAKVCPFISVVLCMASRDEVFQLYSGTFAAEKKYIVRLIGMAVLHCLDAIVVT